MSVPILSYQVIQPVANGLTPLKEALIPQTLKGALSQKPSPYFLQNLLCPPKCTIHFSVCWHISIIIWFHIFTVGLLSILRGDGANNQGEVNSHALRVYVPPTPTTYSSCIRGPGPISSNLPSVRYRAQARGMSQAGRNKLQPILPETPG